MTQNQVMTLIEERRMELGISGPGLAEKAGISKEAYGNWLAGNNSPSMGNLLRVFDALKLQVKIIPEPTYDISPCMDCPEKAVCCNACHERKAYELRREEWRRELVYRMAE